MTLELATKLTYFALGLSLIILCTSLGVLKRARSHMNGVKRMAEPWWFAEKRDTVILPEGYHEGS